MIFNRRHALAFAGGLLLSIGSTSAFAADTTINISLWDRGPDSAMMDEMHPKGMGKGMMGGKMAMAMDMMGIEVDKAEVPAGKVTFEVVNASKDIIHEMVISPISAADAAVPYIIDENKIDEDVAGHLGEVAELDPGKSGTLAIDLKPGLYLLYCNIPAHYIGGMWTLLTVTE